jgi:hypothetical protein
MRTTPLRFHPDPDNTATGGRSPGADAAKSNAARSNPRAGDPPAVQAQQSTEDPDRPNGELRQDVMPDLSPADGGTPNPT